VRAWVSCHRLLVVLVAGTAIATAACTTSAESGTESRRVSLLTAACAAREYSACDELAAEEGAPTSARQFGATCGDLRSTPAGSCLDRLSAVSPPGAAAGSGCLSEGARGDAVRDLQQRLNAAGADPPLVVDGEFGPRTKKAVEEQLGKAAFCRSDSERLVDEQAAFVAVPDVRREPEAQAVNELKAMAVDASTSERCSDLIQAGAVVAVRYERTDGTTLTVYDAEAPVDSETNLIPPTATIELVVSQGPCQTTAG
jgi:hypothetical protein